MAGNVVNLFKTFVFRTKFDINFQKLANEKPRNY